MRLLIVSLLIGIVLYIFWYYTRPPTILPMSLAKLFLPTPFKIYEIQLTPYESELASNLKKFLYSKFQITLDDEWLNYTVKTLSTNNPQLEVTRILYYNPATSTASKLRLGQYILYKTDSNDEVHTILAWIYRIGTTTDDTLDSATALDILRLSNNPLYKIRAENAIQARREEPIRTNIITTHLTPLEKRLKRPKTLYKDGQNVHTSSINESVLDTFKNLKSYQSVHPPSISYLFNQVPQENIATLRKVYNRILSDSSRFRDNITLESAFNCLINYIQQHQHRDELEKRLLEEMMDMHGQCATGHLSRLANVLQGFESRIKLDIKEEIYAKLSHIVQIKAAENDKLMDIILEPSLPEFRKAIEDIANELQPELIQEYREHSINDVSTSLKSAVNKYCGK